MPNELIGIVVLEDGSTYSGVTNSTVQLITPEDHEKLCEGLEPDDITPEFTMPVGGVDTTSMHTFMSTIRCTFPEATLDEDNDGQIIIYTGLYQTGDEDAVLTTENPDKR